MKFSIIYEAQMTDPSPASEYQNFQEIMEQSLLAEALGFDCIWAVEHTALTQYAHMSAPETFLAFLAGRTTRIHVGHGVVCLPPKMNHPVKVAERIATLDILSQGRVHFGVGKGGTQQEAGTFGYDLAQLQPMIDESMYLIPKIMTQDEIEHNGKYVQIPRRPIHPKPYQKPHPLMYLACTRDETLLTAGSRALGALVLGFGGPDDIARKNAVYRKAFAERKQEDQVGFRPNQHLAALCPAIVMDDREKARRIGLRGQRFFAEAINYWYQGGSQPSIDDLSAEEHLKQMEARKSTIGARIGEDQIPASSSRALLTSEINDSYGTVDDCIHYVQRLFDAGSDEILFLVQMGTVPHAASMETIRNIGERVIPHFRSRQ
jgi:alkanesulfonate monooxygenase SsuD/methylene tetrahydromethanopterin reductase-like flavin-dependent oxidoreductase (luciferase family)